ncbi:hypothetical protein EB00_02724 [Enterococcus faecium]|nr:hypothetical protein OIA_05090 [Enterococcus faecium EnGen0018]RBT20077.1 hypothetical protein EB00_02724 [Enterococcus faecium]
MISMWLILGSFIGSVLSIIIFSSCLMSKMKE